MSLTTDLDAFSSISFPDRGVLDPAKKTPWWIMRMTGAGVTEFMRSEPDWRLWAHDRNIAENIRYAEGKQDTRQYTRLKTGEGLNANSLEVTNRDGHFEPGPGGEELHVSRSRGGAGAPDPMGLDSIIKAKPLPLLPTKLRGLKSTVMQQGYEATITALGKKAQQEAADHEALARLWMVHKEELAEQGQVPPTELPDPMPETEAEMRTYLDNWQVAAAAELERKVKIVWIESGGNQLMSEVADDILRHGYGCMADFQLPGRRPVSMRIMPHKGLFLPSAFPDYRDMEMGGFLQTLNLDTVLAEASEGKNDWRKTCNAEGKNWSKPDKARLQQLAKSTLPESMTNNTGIDPLLGNAVNSGTVTVVRWFFRTDDTLSNEAYRDKNGYPKNKKVAYDQEEPTMEGGRIDRATINSLYECTLICGTNLAYGCRKVLDQGFDLHNPSKAAMPFSIFVAGLVAGEPISVVQNAKGIVDEIERSYRAYMAVKRTYTPAGSNFPPDLLSAMADALKIGGKNKELAAYQFIKTQGDSWFPRTNPDMPGQPIVNPITANPFGMPKEAAEHLADVFQQLQLLELVTGANAVVSAATPTGDAQGKGVNQIALQGAANVMSFLRDGLKLIYERHTRNLAGRIWLTEKDVPVTGVVSELNGTRKQVGPVRDLHKYEFFYEVNLGPTNDEKTQFKQNAFMATQGGPAAQLNFDDYLQVCWLIEGNLKTAQQFMNVAVARKARKDEQKALALQKANGDVQTQTAQAAATAQQETDAKASQLRMAELQFARETSWGTVDKQTEAQKFVAQGNQQAKIEATRIAELGHAARTDADNAHAKEHTVLTAALTPEPQPAAA